MTSLEVSTKDEYVLMSLLQWKDGTSIVPHHDDLCGPHMCYELRRRGLLNHLAD